MVLQDIYCEMYSTSENKKIDDLILEMQLKIDQAQDIVFEWISYSQFDNIKEINTNDIATVYSAIWKDGPLNYDKDNKKYTRNSGKEIILKCLQDSHNTIDEVLNEVV